MGILENNLTNQLNDADVHFIQKIREYNSINVLSHWGVDTIKSLSRLHDLIIILTACHPSETAFDAIYQMATSSPYTLNSYVADVILSDDKLSQECIKHQAEYFTTFAMFPQYYEYLDYLDQHSMTHKCLLFVDYVKGLHHSDASALLAWVGSSTRQTAIVALVLCQLNQIDVDTQWVCRDDLNFNVVSMILLASARGVNARKCIDLCLELLDEHHRLQSVFVFDVVSEFVNLLLSPNDNAYNLLIEAYAKLLQRSVYASSDEDALRKGKKRVDKLLRRSNEFIDKSKCLIT